MRKAHSGKHTLQAFNPNIRVEATHEEISERNVFDIAAHYPIVDAMDNLATRYLLNKAALQGTCPSSMEQSTA